MCVIFVAQVERPPSDMLEGGHKSNPYGGGIAWRHNGHVVFKKGLNLAEVKELAATVPLPYVVHFRIPSSGSDDDELCHPFPVAAEVPLMVNGRTKKGVVFHNGHWSQWGLRMQEALIHLGRRTPKGQWSDTRAMAFLAHYYGVEYLELLDEKVVYFSPSELRFFGKGWQVEQKVQCSNLYWKQSYSYGGGYSGYGAWSQQQSKVQAPVMAEAPKLLPAPVSKAVDYSNLSRKERRQLKARLDAYGRSKAGSTYLSGEYADVQSAIKGTQPRCCASAQCNTPVYSNDQFCHRCRHELDRLMQDDYLQGTSADSCSVETD